MLQILTAGGDRRGKREETVIISADGGGGGGGGRSDRSSGTNDRRRYLLRSQTMSPTFTMTRGTQEQEGGERGRKREKEKIFQSLQVMSAWK